MQEANKSNRLAASGEVLYTHTSGHWQPAFINTFPCLFETLYSVSHCVSSGALSVGWMFVHEPGPPPLPHLSLCSLLGVYMLHINALFTKHFPAGKSPLQWRGRFPLADSKCFGCVFFRVLWSVKAFLGLQIHTQLFDEMLGFSFWRAAGWNQIFGGSFNSCSLI